MKSFRPVAAMLLAGIVLAACSGGGGGSDDSTSSGGPGSSPGPSGTSTIIEDREDAARFLSYATYGASQSDIDAMIGRDAADWLATQFNMAPTLYLARVNALAPEGTNAAAMHSSDLMWDAMVASRDQLRTRMVFALSQIMVVEDMEGGRRPRRAAYYMDVLANNAFGNYRDLLEDVTYSPIMSRFLTYYGNRKGDPNTGRMPDENYAREVMQLFSIGVVELNLDGTIDMSSGNAVETYSNEDVAGLSRVFTGMHGKGERFGRADDDALYSRLVIYDDQHSSLEKQFLGTTIPANTPGVESVDIALDTLADHPNVGPFISRQLIQRFTASNPDPAYVERVATAFNTGSYRAQNGRNFGTGARGDLEATLAAILLDETLWDDVPDEGKIREPILQFVNWARAFNVANVNANNERELQDTNRADRRLSQHPMRARSVFNFYRPGYIAPNSESGAAGMTAPELQILNETSTLGYIEFMSRFVFDRSSEDDDTLDTYRPDYSDEAALAEDPALLADHLNMLLSGGRMETATRSDIIETLELMPIGTEEPDIDRLRRVHVAVLITINAPSYRVIR